MATVRPFWFSPTGLWYRCITWPKSVMRWGETATLSRIQTLCVSKGERAKMSYTESVYCVYRTRDETWKMGSCELNHFLDLQMKKEASGSIKKNGCPIWKPTFLHTPSLLEKVKVRHPFWGFYTPPPPPHTHTHNTHTHTHTHTHTPYLVWSRFWGFKL